MKVQGQYNQSICSWPEDDRPRERMLKYGEHKLSNSELLAILLRTGMKGQSALDLARNILNRFKTFRQMSKAGFNEWKSIKGVGSAKVSQIKAAIEIGRRFGEAEVKHEAHKIRSSRDVAEMLMPRMRDLKNEVFKVIHLDSQNGVIDVLEESEGTVNQANPFIREIFKNALERYSVSIICVHNHPSGSHEPSREDKMFTRKLFEAGRIMQINVLDHIIIGNDLYYSFADNGLK